jgi:hypothetical protein
MSSQNEQLSASLDILNKDIIEGIENGRVEKIPFWKKAMVSFKKL